MGGEIRSSGSELETFLDELETWGLHG